MLAQDAFIFRLLLKMTVGKGHSGTHYFWRAHAQTFMTGGTAVATCRKEGVRLGLPGRYLLCGLGLLWPQYRQDGLLGMSGNVDCRIPEGGGGHIDACSFAPEIHNVSI